MRKTWFLSCLILLSVFWCLPIYGQQLSSYVKDGVIRVKLEPAVAQQLGNTPKTRGGIVSTGIQPLDKINKDIKAVEMKRVFPYAPKFEERMRKHGLHLWYEISYDAKLTPEQAADKYKGISGIKIAEIVRVQDLPKYKSVPANLPSGPRTRAGEPFNDPGLVNQWHYRNDGRVQGSIAGSDINAFEAWKITTGARNVVVAIIDGGIDIQHEDLIDNLWINEAELNGEEGVDDDGNGYVDDIYGYNFCTNSGTISAHPHGTHVAGTVGAVNNNGKGVSGVAGGSGNNDGVRLMSCQVFDDKGQGDFAKPFVYAANAGAVIAQCSWGWTAPGFFEQAVLDAMDYFTEEAGQYEGSPMKGGLCIFSAGNTQSEGEFYPGAYPTAVAVTAMSVDFKMSNFSTRGVWTDVCAPGGDMDLGGEAWGVLSTYPNNGYRYMQGTSMACPHVSGIAALVLAKYGGSDFTNAELRTRLTESVHDIYPYNPEYLGKLGNGYIDAYMALGQKNTNPPAVINDIKLIASQEDIHTEWKVPADPDGDPVSRCIVYYSEQAFTASSDLSALKSMTLATRFNKAGDVVHVMIPNLKAETNYWIAIRAFDRWNNASPLSEVKQIATNAGPVMEIAKDKFTLKMDVTQSYDAIDSMEIKNTGEGMLKWELDIRGSKQSFTPRSNSALLTMASQEQAISNSSVYHGSVTGVEEAPVKIIESGVNMDEFPRNIKYYREYLYRIGESDTAQWNSLAQFFYISPDFFPNGFNLTGIQLNGVYSKGQPILEIYQGVSNFTAEDCLLSDTLPARNPFIGDLVLSENLYFKPGSGFWVVFHMPRGHKNPLACGHEIENSNAAQYSYYSSDRGKTWSTLKSVLSEGNLSQYANTQTWIVSAVSHYPDWTNYITLTPASGTVKPSEAQKVYVAPEKVKLINGVYNFNLSVNSNYNQEPQKKVPGTLTVSGHKPNLQSAKIVDFGKIFVGEKKTLEIEIYNAGYGKFNGKSGSSLYEYDGSIQFSPANNFKLTDGYIQSFAARTTQKVKIDFKPDHEDVFKSVFKLTSKEGLTHSITLTGTAIDPAKITVDPTQIAVGDLEINAAPVTKSFTISNTGSYPLEYIFPKFTDETIEGLGKTSHKHGFEYISNIPGYNENAACIFQWEELLNANEVQNQLVGNMDFWTEGVNIGFKFPFYDKEFETVYIGQYGALSFSGEEGTLHSCMIPDASPTCTGGLDLISALGKPLTFSPESKIMYAKQNGKFVVSYENVIPQYSNVTVSFRIALSPNGDIDIAYKKYDPYEVHLSDGIFIACIDYDVNDAFVVASADLSRQGIDLWQYIGDETAIKITAPGKNMIRSISPLSGVIGMNETQTIEVTFSADTTMYKGELTNLLALLCNDPNKSTSIIRFDANITGDYYQPHVILGNDSLLFGNIMQHSTSTGAVSLINNGKDQIAITDITLSNTDFTINKTVPFILKPGTSEDLYIKANTTSKGNFETLLTIKTEKNQELTAHILSSVVAAPDLTVTPTIFAETMKSGDSKTVHLDIKNTGEADLNYMIVPNTLFFPANDTLKEGEKAEYLYKSSLDFNDVTNQWEDITDSEIYYGEKYFRTNVSFAQELPFSFTFYGKKYNKIYVYGPGFITFKDFPPLDMWPEDFRADFTPYIAPYWGHHSPVPAEYSPTGIPGGIYYKEETDRVIISFLNYGNVVSLGLCYQAILYKNGNIKFQYKLSEGGIQIGAFGISGLAYEGASYDDKERMTLAERYLDMNSAVEFYPVRTSSLKAGENADVEMTINTAGLMAGHHPTKNVIRTNVPNKEEIELLLDLTLTGTPQGSWPEKLEYADITVGTFVTTPYDFFFRNTGTDYYHITGLSCKTTDASPDPWDMPDFDILYWSKDAVAWPPTPDGGEGALVSIREMPIDTDSPLEIGKNPQRFVIQIFNTQNVMNMNDTLVFTTDLPGHETIRIPLQYAVVDSAEVTVDPAKIDLYAPNTTFSCDTTVVISNTGKYKLTYTLDLEFKDNTTPAQASQSNNAAPAITKGYILDYPVAQATMGSTQSTRSGEAYNDSLSYNFDFEGKILVLGPQASALSAYIVCTEYTAPEKGFNISTLKFYGSLMSLESEDFVAEVRTGNSFSDNKVLTSGTLRATGGPEIDGGQPIINIKTIEFDHPAYINPGEKFWVYIYIKPNTGIALMSVTDPATEGRFTVHLEGTWDDLLSLQSQYGVLGFLQKIYEKEASSAWLTMEGEEKTLQPEESVKISLHANAALTRGEGNNLANLVIKSNDPGKPTTIVPVTLKKNTAPVITQLDKTIRVKEEEEATVRFTVIDNENDDMEISVIEDEQNIASLTRDQNNITVTLSPKYGQSGDHTFTLKAVDEFTNERQLKVAYYVEKVNRAPIVIQQPGDKTVKIGKLVEGLELGTVFSDPDGDELTYTAISSHPDTVEVFVSATHTLEFVLKAKGEATVTLTAKDPELLQATTTFKVTVEEEETSGSGIFEAQVKTYPNPATNVLNIQCSDDVDGEVIFRLYSMNGSIVYTEKTAVTTGSVKELDITSLPAGMYILEVEHKGDRITSKVVKQ